MKNIKIICINIAGKLNEKILTIKNFLIKENPDILCLQKIHTYIKNFTAIQDWFKNDKYDLIYYSESQKQRYKELKIRKIAKIRVSTKHIEKKKEMLINQ